MKRISTLWALLAASLLALSTIGVMSAQEGGTFTMAVTREGSPTCATGEQLIQMNFSVGAGDIIFQTFNTSQPELSMDAPMTLPDDAVDRGDFATPIEHPFDKVVVQLIFDDTVEELTFDTGSCGVTASQTINIGGDLPYDPGAVIEVCFFSWRTGLEEPYDLRVGDLVNEGWLIVESDGSLTPNESNSWAGIYLGECTGESTGQPGLQSISFPGEIVTYCDNGVTKSDAAINFAGDAITNGGGRTIPFLFQYILDWNKVPAGITAGPCDLAQPVDTDGDGIPDYADRCPDVVGNASDGCFYDFIADGWQVITHTSGDVVIEYCWNGQNESATVAQIRNGEVEGVYIEVWNREELIPWPELVGITPGECLNPVPVDTDGDGVNDDVDECPEVAGAVENGGCPAVNIPGVWNIDVVSLACTAEGVDVTYSIGGAENVPTDGDMTDVQIRPAEGGTPIVSEFGEVSQGNPGPYTVSIESADLSSGVFQAWVFKVGTNDHVYSEAISCGEEPVAPAEPGEGEMPGEGETPASPTDGNTGSEGGDTSGGGKDAVASTSNAGTVTGLPSTGTGSTAANTTLLTIVAVAGMTVLACGLKLRRIQ